MYIHTYMYTDGDFPLSSLIPRMDMLQLFGFPTSVVFLTVNHAQLSSGAAAKSRKISFQLIGFAGKDNRKIP